MEVMCRGGTLSVHVIHIETFVYCEYFRLILYFEVDLSVLVYNNILTILVSLNNPVIYKCQLGAPNDKSYINAS